MSVVHRNDSLARIRPSSEFAYNIRDLSEPTFSVRISEYPVAKILVPEIIPMVPSTSRISICKFSVSSFLGLSPHPIIISRSMAHVSHGILEVKITDILDGISIS
jgi:hypothetical protein